MGNIEVPRKFPFSQIYDFRLDFDSILKIPFPFLEDSVPVSNTFPGSDNVHLTLTFSL